MGSLLGDVGNVISGVGGAIGLPDLGIGNALGGSNTLPGALQNVPASLNTGRNASSPDFIQSNTQVAAPLADPNAPGSTDAATQQLAQQQAAAQNNQNLINTQLGLLPGQQQTGTTNINNAYQSALDNLLNGKNTALNTLGNQRAQTNQNYVNSVSGIDQGVSNTNSGIQRLLGSHGAGNSSAASILAPYASARQGAIQRGQVENTYGQNKTALDNSANDISTQFNNSSGLLGTQKQSQLDQLLSGIDSSKAALLAQEASPDQAAIAALGQQVNQLGVNPTFTPQAVNLKAPTLNDYAYNPTAAPAISSGLNPAQAQNTGAYWTLLNGLKDKTNQPATAGV